MTMPLARPLAVLIALAWSPALAAGSPPSPRPNIILILADAMGYADAGCFGGQAAATPHLDALAASGVKLTRFYASSTVCSPTRASILSGRYPLRFDIRQHFPDDESRRKRCQPPNLGSFRRPHRVALGGLPFHVLNSRR